MNKHIYESFMYFTYLYEYIYIYNYIYLYSRFFNDT